MSDDFHHPPHLVALHKTSSKHRKLVKMAYVCGCFCCLAVFDPEEITTWTDFVQCGDCNGAGCPDCTFGEVGQTALCPKCGVDAVLPSDRPLDPKMLAEMEAYWMACGPD